MRHTKKKISKIIEELLAYCDSLEATSINFHIEHCETCHHIHITSNYHPDYEPCIEKLDKHLNSGRRPHLEENYWTLTGSSDLEEEMQLMLIGAMIDSCEIRLEEGYLTLHLIRNRNIDNGLQ